MRSTTTSVSSTTCPFYGLKAVIVTTATFVSYQSIGLVLDPSGKLVIVPVTYTYREYTQETYIFVSQPNPMASDSEGFNGFAGQEEVPGFPSVPISNSDAPVGTR